MQLWEFGLLQAEYEISILIRSSSEWTRVDKIFIQRGIELDRIEHQI